MTGYLIIIGCKLVVSECSVVVVELNAGHIPAVPHQRFVVSYQLHGVLQVPAVATEVLEARQVPAEVRTLLQQTIAAESILQVGVNLNLLRELACLDLDESCTDRLHVALGVAEGDSPGSNGILVSVSVDACVHDSTKQIIEDVSKTLGIEHSVESSNKDSLLRIQSLAGTPHIVAVSKHPGNHLRLLVSHAPT